MSRAGPTTTKRDGFEDGFNSTGGAPVANTGGSTYRYERSALLSHLQPLQRAAAADQRVDAVTTGCIGDGAPCTAVPQY